jgi:hypothetical protein
LATPRSAPARPRIANTQPTEKVVPEKPADPLIVPGLTPAEVTAAKNDTQHSLETAEANLAQMQGKKLDSTQEDLVAKIRGFMETAQDAEKSGDWPSARNLAKKAEVLSRELVAKP